MRRRGKKGMSPTTAGVIAIVLIAIGSYLGFTKAIPFEHHFTIHAVFRSSNNVKKASPVRIAGVNVGKVTSVTPAGHDESASIVSMQIDDQGLPIHTDATVKVRPRIFLEGNFFVDLFPGSPSAPKVKDGFTIPIQQASAPVQLDQILGSLKHDTRANLQTLLEEYGKAVKEGGPGFNRSIPYWKAAYEYSSEVNQATLGTAPHDLSGYIDQAGVVAGALDRNPPALQSLITDFNTTANAFARQSANLSATIAELPRTLHAAQPALAALNAAFPPVRALAKALDPGVVSTGPMIDASLPFIRQARLLVSEPELRGLVADLRPTVPDLARLTSESVPLYQQVRLASSCQNQVILPWSHLTLPDSNFPAHAPVYVEATQFLPGIAGESRDGDANGQWFRVLAGVNLNTYALGTAANPVFGQALSPIMGLQPPKPQVRPPIRPNVPCETQQVPNLSAADHAPPPSMPLNPSSPGTKSLMAPIARAAVKQLRTEAKAQGGAHAAYYRTLIAAVSRAAAMGGGK